MGHRTVWKYSSAPLIPETVEINYLTKPRLEVWFFRKAEVGMTFLKDRKTKICRLLSKRKKEETRVQEWEKRRLWISLSNPGKGDPLLDPAVPDSAVSPKHPSQLLFPSAGSTPSTAACPPSSVGPPQCLSHSPSAPCFCQEFCNFNVGCSSSDTPDG